MACAFQTELKCRKKKKIEIIYTQMWLYNLEWFILLHYIYLNIVSHAFQCMKYP